MWLGAVGIFHWYSWGAGFQPQCCQKIKKWVCSHCLWDRTLSWSLGFAVLCEESSHQVSRSSLSIWGAWAKRSLLLLAEGVQRIWGWGQQGPHMESVTQAGSATLRVGTVSSDSGEQEEAISRGSHRRGPLPCRAQVLIWAAGSQGKVGVLPALNWSFEIRICNGLKGSGARRRQNFLGSHSVSETSVSSPF